MAFCTKCGNAISSDAKFCPGCGASVISALVSPASSGTAAPSTTQKMNSNQKVLVFIIAIVLGLITINAFRLNSGSGQKTFHSYSSVLDAFGKAVTKADGELYYRTIYPKGIYVLLNENTIAAMSDNLAFTNAFISEFTNSSSPKYEFSISEKQKMDADDLRSVESEYNRLSDKTYEIEEGYNVRVVIYLNGKKDSESIPMEIVKIKGEGWKLTPSSSDNYTGANLSY